VFHATFTGAEAYSSPSVVLCKKMKKKYFVLFYFLASRDRSGNKMIIDDFREGYYW